MKKEFSMLMAIKKPQSVSIQAFILFFLGYRICIPLTCDHGRSDKEMKFNFF